MDKERTVLVADAHFNGRISLFYNGGVIDYNLQGIQSLGCPSGESMPAIPVNSKIVSRNHGEFETAETGTMYRDLGSANGTEYRGSKLEAESPVYLRSGDVLRVHCDDDGIKDTDVLIMYSESSQSSVWNRISLESINELRIGRGELLKLYNPEVSRKHAVFYRMNDSWMIIDQGSTNGVYLNGKRVTGSATLNDYDVVCIASYLFIYFENSLFYQCDTESAIINYRKAVGEINKSETGNVQPDEYKIAPIMSEPWKDASGEVDPWKMASPKMESRKAEPLVKKVSAPVDAMDVLKAPDPMLIAAPVVPVKKSAPVVAPVVPVKKSAPVVAPVVPVKKPAPIATPIVPVVREHSASGKSLNIDIKERAVWKFGRKKLLLKDVKLNIKSGSMVLILGGSGAGKTTFMNAVMGYEQASGSIVYDGINVYKEFDKMQYEIGYVPQQDLMRMNDDALSTVINAAELKLPTGMGANYYESKAEKAMETLGLADEKKQMVRALSGGQRKRLSIAMEYVGDPSLFFLDEPDSGVDNTNSELLLRNLRKIADEGKIVVFISHSPDRAFEMLDNIIVLAKDSANDCGRLVFYGSPKKALEFFEVDSLNKIVTRINKKNEGGDGLADHYIAKFEKERR